MEEIWKVLDDTEGRRKYSGKVFVSSLGNFQDQEGNPIKYWYIQGYKQNRFGRVHRIVAEMFIPNPENLATVNHKDLNKLNNSVSNLEYLSRRDNTIHYNTMAYANPELNKKNRIQYSELGIKARVTVFIDKDEYKRLKIECAKAGITITDWFRKTIKSFVKKHS